MANEVLPTALRREGDGLLIDWADGATTFITWTALRKACPCAACTEDGRKPPDPFRVLTPQEVAAGPSAPTAMRPVGRYAYQITWNDGHDTGIYPLDLLRQLGKMTKNQ